MLRYTQTFALSNIAEARRRRVVVDKVAFNYATETWIARQYELPFLAGDYVILTPKDTLTKDDTWISRTDMLHSIRAIVAALPDAQLRSHINNYFLRVLSKKSTVREEREAAARVVEMYPEILDWYIRHQEDRGPNAERVSRQHVEEVGTTPYRPSPTTRRAVAATDDVL